MDTTHELYDSEWREALAWSGVLSPLLGNWRFIADTAQGDTGLVDVPLTNDRMVFGEINLDHFAAIHANDPRVAGMEDIVSQFAPIDPHRIVFILLCGGLGTRSSGQVHPLLEVRNPADGKTAPLLSLQLARFHHSPLAHARLMLFASRFNVHAIIESLRDWPDDLRPIVYTGGIAPRLSRSQPIDGSPLPNQDSYGKCSYNPTGHFDALRWLFISGLFDSLVDASIIIFASYSNWSLNLYQEETLRLASYAETLHSQETLFLGEVAEKPSSKRNGSILVERIDPSGGICLVKHAYGSGNIILPENADLLMSTNTLYFSTKAIARRLHATSQLSFPEDNFFVGFAQSDQYNRHAQKAAQFDAAFPINPYLSLKPSPDGSQAIQVERDLDQLSLLRQGVSYIPVRVGKDRTLSFKHRESFENPDIISNLFKT